MNAVGEREQQIRRERRRHLEPARHHFDAARLDVREQLLKRGTSR